MLRRISPFISVSNHSSKTPFVPGMILLIFICTSSCRALTINFNDTTGMTSALLELYERAAADWESRFTDPVTVNINIGYELLGGNVLMSTQVSRTSQTVFMARMAMLVDAMSNASEATAVNQLPLWYMRVSDIDSDRRDYGVTMCTANAKALGLATSLDNDYANLPSGVDAEIMFNMAYANQFDFDPSDGIAYDKCDFVGIIKHEIGHALGFLSVTDMQDNNPGFTLHPHPLDLFRFPETTGTHDLTSEFRRITAGGAEYYDTVLNNVPFSHGTNDGSDPYCLSTSCQASHWSDDQQNLMDPTMPEGIEAQITNHDIHALDYIGWDRDVMLYYPLDSVQVGWMLVHEINDIPDFGDWFDNFAILPDPNLLYPPPEANVAVRVGLNLGFDGGRNRSGLGYARFDPCVPIEPNVVVSLLPVEGEEYLDPPGPPAKEIPPRLSDVFIVSDYQGVPFTFTSNSGKEGCPFDPTLGEYGGYRIPGFIDGQGDKKIGDVDALLTMILLADASGVPMPGQHNIFSTYTEYQDNNIIIYDAQAIGAILPPHCGDELHPRPKADLDGNCMVDFKDLSKFADEWLICTAPICP